MILNKFNNNLNMSQNFDHLEMENMIGYSGHRLRTIQFHP